MLLPAHYIKVSDGVLTAEKYWLPETNVQFINPSRKDAVAEVREKLKQAVRKRLVSDVSFGAFLSGGIDSSAVVALMAQEMDRPVETFNIAFNESEFSEAKYARMIAAKYKTRHHEIVIRPDEFVNHIPAALDAMDHPGADGPNTWVVSRAAKQAGVTMVLSGLGGDEFFGGYDVFKRIPTLDERKWLLSFPRPLRSAAGFLLRTMKPSVSSEKTASLLVQDYWHLEYTYRFSRMTVLEKDIKEMLIGQPKVINRVYNIVKDLCGPEKPGQRFDRFTQISLAEMNTYLPNVLLRDTDQMSMAHALEVRVPMLDHKVVEYLLSLPAHLKQSATSPKQLLVEAMGNDLPSQLIDRPKMGFTFPWKEWLKKDLYELTSSHLESLSNRPEFNKAFISRIWQSFLTDDPRSRWAVIWNLVVLEHYLQKNGIQ